MNKKQEKGFEEKILAGIIHLVLSNTVEKSKLRSRMKQIKRWYLTDIGNMECGN